MTTGRREIRRRPISRPMINARMQLQRYFRYRNLQLLMVQTEHLFLGPARSPLSDSTTSGNERLVFQFPPRLKGVCDGMNLPSSSPESPLPPPLISADAAPLLSRPPPPRKRSSMVVFKSPPPSTSQSQDLTLHPDPNHQSTTTEMPTSTIHTSSSPQHSSNQQSSSPSNAEGDSGQAAVESKSAPAGIVEG